MANNKILLCSPKVSTGGISMWTRHILDYYSSHKSNFELDWFYPGVENVNWENRSICRRIVTGVKQYFPFIVKLSKKLNSENYSALHMCSSASFGLMRDVLALQLCRWHKMKYIIHFHFGRIPEIYREKNWEYKLMNLIVRNSDNVVVIDKASYETLVNFGYENISDLPNPLSGDIVKIVNEYSSEIIRKPNKIVFVGHVIKTKGINELMVAVKVVRHKYPVNVTILGQVTDAVRERLTKVAGFGWNEWLTIAGNQSVETVVKELLSSGLFVLPTYTEGFPNVVLESMACSCPIISTPVGAIPEMLNIDSATPCGIVVPVGDTDNLARQIENAITHYDQFQNMAERARVRVMSLYSIDSVWLQLTNIWIKTLNDK